MAGASGLQSLGYVGIGTQRLADWSRFSSELLGMQVSAEGRAAVSLRMDERRQRLFIDNREAEGCHTFGWEVEDRAALESLASRLDTAKVAVRREGQDLSDRRMVEGLISFTDPIGNRLEVFYGPAIAADTFHPGRPISGFRTGALGLGHVVFTVESIDRVMPFYTDLLGFRVSDYALQPFRAHFFHINRRHHSLALIETGRNGLHHLMFEVYSLDDVGQAYDLALTNRNRIDVTLGRHSNDFVTSFYVNSPSDFMIEYGWGGREVDDATWQPVELKNGASLWGHERSWLPPAQQAVARELRKRAMAQGDRAPVQVIEGNYQLMAGSSVT